MSDIVTKLRQRASARRRRVIFPEYYDDRVLLAVCALAERGIVEPVLLDIPDSSEIEIPNSVDVFSRRYDAAQWRDSAIQGLVALRVAKGLTRDDAEQALKNPLLLAAVLVHLGFVDCGVAGSTATTADVLRAGIQGIGVAKKGSQISSSFLMELTDGRVLSYADCAVIPNPDSQALANIAISAADVHHKLTGERPYVAMLSFSTKGSSDHEMVNKVRTAVDIIRVLQPDLDVDGELQFDAAFLPEIAVKKAASSTVAGKANVLVFPDLNAGNIAYKITQRIGGAKALGPILQGFDRPWMDLSRGCSVDDIVIVATIAAVLS